MWACTGREACVLLVEACLLLPRVRTHQAPLSGVLRHASANHAFSWCAQACLLFVSNVCVRAHASLTSVCARMLPPAFSCLPPERRCKQRCDPLQARAATPCLLGDQPRKHACAGAAVWTEKRLCVWSCSGKDASRVSAMTSQIFFYLASASGALQKARRL